MCSQNIEIDDVLEKEDQQFLDDYVALCRKHKMAITHCSCCELYLTKFEVLEDLEQYNKEQTGLEHWPGAKEERRKYDSN